MPNPSTTATALEISGLAFSRNGRTLCAGLDLALCAGEWCEITGANGAGKTTLLRILCGLSEADGGAFQWRGLSPARDGGLYHQQVLYIGHKSGFRNELSVAANLAFYSGLGRAPAVNANKTANAHAANANKTPRTHKADANQTPRTHTANTNKTTHPHNANTVAAAIAAQDDFGIAGWLDTPCAKLSQGQLRRAALSRLLIERASLWLLDEPGVGLDRDGVARLEHLLAAHLANGGAALVATHATLSPPGHHAAHHLRLGEDV